MKDFMENFKKFEKYIYYIKAVPHCSIASFDSDWMPIGPRVRKDMRSVGLIFESKGKIYLYSQTSPRK